MIGYFQAIDTTKNKMVGKYKYTTVSDTTKAWLRKNSDHLKLTCCCNANCVEIKISSDLKIYPAKNDTGNLHDKNCPKHPDVRYSLWESEKDGDIYYQVAGADTNAKDFALKVNEMTSQRLFRNMKNPSDYKEFNKSVYGTLGQIKTNDNKILKDIYSSHYRAPSEIDIDGEVFVYGILRRVQSTPFSKDVLYIDIEDIFGCVSRFYILKNIFVEMYNASRAKYYRLLVCGFAYKSTKKSKIMTISDFYMTAMDDQGMIF